MMMWGAECTWWLWWLMVWTYTCLGISTDGPGTAEVAKLVVSAGGNRELQLPENSITLWAFVLPPAGTGEEYHYKWRPVDQPKGSEETATMQGKNSNSLQLSNLTAGLYVMKVEVTGRNKFGEAFVNITVLPPTRQNQPPVAVIKPFSQQVESENSFVLDGSGSRDDDGIVAYHWEEVSGPLQEHQIVDDCQTLKLQDMAPGHYVFRLTVTDTDGATNSTSAEVTVIKETDYPPKANAGSDVIIHLPQKSLVLCGNSSTDDRGIASYEWIKKSDSLTADMTGVRTECLQLNNLELGDYTFTLSVVDTGGNTATADVHVYVKPEKNHPPVAQTAGEITVALPTDRLVLDGHNSTDDTGIKTYTWTQTGGPTSLTLIDSDQAVAVAIGEIVVGDYEFELTVNDIDRQTSTGRLTVHVSIDANHAPVARAGGDKVVLLPVSVVALDGTLSTDDCGIVSYFWERGNASLAAGDVMNDSDHQAVLQLMNLVTGHYLFTLTVVDQQGLSSTDTVNLVVKNGEQYKDLVELVLDTDIHHFTQQDKISVVKQLELLSHQSSQLSGSVVQIQSTQQELTNGQLRLTFFVRTSEGITGKGVDIAEFLRSRLQDGVILTYPIVALDTVVCQSNCSGHGQCDQRTRTCHCEMYWMPNLFSLLYRHHSNCEWSVIYFVVVCLLAFVSIVSSTWTLVHCCVVKRCQMKTRKRHRYSRLWEEKEEEDSENMEMPVKGKTKNGVVMMSESDLSSEEEALFISNQTTKSQTKPLNGVMASQLHTDKRNS